MLNHVVWNDLNSSIDVTNYQQNFFCIIKLMPDLLLGIKFFDRVGSTNLSFRIICNQFSSIAWPKTLTKHMQSNVAWISAVILSRSQQSPWANNCLGIWWRKYVFANCMNIANVTICPSSFQFFVRFGFFFLFSVCCFSMARKQNCIVSKKKHYRDK